MDDLVLPPDGATFLADVLPSFGARFGIDTPHNPAALPDCDRLCVLLIDGLGWRLLTEHGSDAPFLGSLAAKTSPIYSGFPATTATGLASLGTGKRAGAHGIVGLTFPVADDLLLNVLGWNTHGPGRSTDLRDTVVPEEAQPAPTMLEQFVSAGVEVRTVLDSKHIQSGLTRAVFRGGQFRGVGAMGDLAGNILDALSEPGPTFCYAYHGDLDMMGHLYGPGSLPWRMQLAQIDSLVSTLVNHLPAGSGLAVTADHGMVEAPEESRIDFDTDPELQAGVRLLAGEPRARYIHTQPGAEADVFSAWSSKLDGRAWVMSSEDAIAGGCFGPVVTDTARARIGDFVVAAMGDTTIVRSQQEPLLSFLPGQHGSFTEAEQLVPLLVAARR